MIFRSGRNYTICEVIDASEYVNPTKEPDAAPPDANALNTHLSHFIAPHFVSLPL
jgi:hypothetical protein